MTTPSPIARYYINAASELLEESLQLIESAEPLSRGKKPGDYTLPYLEKPTGKKAASTLDLKTSIYGVSYAMDAVRGRILPMEGLRFVGRADVKGHMTEAGQRQYEFERYYHLAKTLTVAPFETAHETTVTLDGATLLISSANPDQDWQDIDRALGVHCAMVNEQIYEGEKLLSTVWAEIRKASKAQDTYLATLQSAKEADEAWEALKAEADRYLRARASRIVEEVVVSADPERAAELGVDGLSALIRAVDKLVGNDLLERSITSDDVAEAAITSDDNAIQLVCSAVAVALGHLKDVLDEFGCASERHGYALFEEVEHLGRSRWAHAETLAGRPHQPVWNGEVLGTSPGWRGCKDRHTEEQAMMRYEDLVDVHAAAKQYVRALQASIKAQRDLDRSEADLARVRAKVAWLVAQTSSGQAVNA